MILRSLSFRTVTAVLFFAALVHTQSIRAQCPTPQSFENMAFENEEGFFTPEKIFPYYTFSMVYDSARVIYDIHEMEHNGQKLWLDVWCFGRVHEAEEELLADSSVSAPFVVHTGDTISFYRHLMWTDGPNGVHTNGFYYALDTLDFVVELLRPNYARAALMDSIGALREVPAGYMNFHGMGDVVDLIRYVVPSELDGLSVRMRIRPYARGEGLYRFMRYDGFMLGRMSASLANPDFIFYREQVNAGTAKQVVPIEDLHHIKVQTGEALTARYSEESQEIIIEFKGIEAVETCSLLLYSTDGKVSERLLESHPLSKAMTIRYYAPASGAYVVAVLRNDVLLTSTKVLVQQ